MRRLAPSLRLCSSSGFSAVARMNSAEPPPISTMSDGAVAAGGGVRKIDGLAHGQVNQAGFFLRGNHLDVETEIELEELAEVRPVGALAHGAGGVGEYDVGIEPAGDRLVAFQHAVGVVHRGARKAVADQGRAAQDA